MSIKRDSNKQKSVLRLGIISVAVMAAFFGAYAYASARSATAAGGAAPILPATTQSAGGGCCGSGQAPASGYTGEKAVGTAKVESGVQRISVDLSSGNYNPNVIQLKAGVPAEITFGQGSSCAAQIQSQDLGFSVDTYSGPQTVKLPALKAGDYSFACSMNMIFGKIVVK